MKRALVLAIFILAALLMQTWFLPRFLPIAWKPDFFVVMVVYLAFFGDFHRGALIGFALGCIMDVFGGSALGLYGLVYTVLFFVIRMAASHINTETPFSFYYMVALGTCIELILLSFIVFIFGNRGGGIWALVTSGLFPQTGLNLLAAFVLMKIFLALRKKTGWGASFPGPPLEEN